MKNKETTTEEMVTELMFAFEGYADINDMNAKILGTFDDLGYLTRNKGFTIRVGDQEFQITVVER
jgi:hypothetical protein